jgi:Protein of unknown function (DUF2971)
MLSSMDTLYHYCSNDAFLSIIQTGRIRLSSLPLSNDSMEGKLVGKLLSKLVPNKILKKKIRQQFQETIEHIDNHYMGFGFCLTTLNDRLSQWRGYADNGSGVAIGFSRKYLNQLITQNSIYHPTLAFKKVIYDSKTQKDTIKPIAKEMIDLINNHDALGSGLEPLNAEDNNTESSEASKIIPFRDTHADLTSNTFYRNNMFILKHSGFKEEHEWRLVTTYLAQHIIENLLYRSHTTGITPYLEINLENSVSRKNDLPIIEKVILGPKNKTPKTVFDQALNSIKIDDDIRLFNDTEVIKSKLTSYR